MLQEDKKKLKELLKVYSAREIMRQFSEVALSAADDQSDEGFKEQAKELVFYAIAMEDLVAGRPFLV